MKVFKSQVIKIFPERCTLGEYLIKLTKMDQATLAEAALKGAVWIQRRSKGKIFRIRNLNETISPEDQVSFFYDPHVLKLSEVSHLDSVYEDENYGVWFKPQGLVSQGSQTSDHASVLRYVEKLRSKEVFLVHRLDRETAGLMIVAYHSKAAGLLSELFLKNKIKKEYEAVVLGEMKTGHKETIKASLDDKEAVTHLEVMESQNNRSRLKVTIETGRLHQIRRHLDFIGHPVIGDPKYGKGNKNREGMKLLARTLKFTDPWSHAERTFSLKDGLSI